MLDDSPQAGPGHNNPPPDLPFDLAAYQPLEQRAREIADAGADWIKLPKIENEEQAQKANDFLAQVRKVEKEAEAERKVQKAPHDARAKAVDVAFKRLTDPLSKIVGPVKAKLLAFAEAKAEAERLEKARRAEEARKAAEEAERLKAQAEERGDVFGQAEAEAAAKDAEKMARSAAKETKTQVKSATGGGRTMAVRTSYVATIENMNKAFGWFRDHERYGQAMRELMVRMAEAERRSAEGVNEIPGVIFTEERSIA
ncbi:hypothetical protein LOS78_01675 [Paracoccus sp. MA]|uniref:hypothetical protein n=1 Tax=Paracoccus sp. MA TaxID=2895796 RepID=UPI001E32FF0A|nr:hypothetical protein [Paracoccus sp. MA]UFM64208.1 hypothetical protein LOS78_01675 [Paracoccus sp. MA]